MCQPQRESLPGLPQIAGTGCSSGAAYTRSVRKRAAAVGLLLAFMSTTPACSAPEEAEGSALCDALGAPVPGIDEIVGDNGFTRQEANWATLLDSGILDSVEASRSTRPLTRWVLTPTASSGCSMQHQSRCVLTSNGSEQCS